MCCILFWFTVQYFVCCDYCLEDQKKKRTTSLQQVHNRRGGKSNLPSNISGQSAYIIGRRLVDRTRYFGAWTTWSHAASHHKEIISLVLFWQLYFM